MIDEENIIYVYHNFKSLDYDIHGLLRAFCPTKAVKITEFNENETKHNYPAWMVVFDTCRWDIKYYDENGHLAYGNFHDAESQNYIESDRLNYKNTLKLFLYDNFRKFYKKELAWGTLTGIRPIKLISQIYYKIGNISDSKKYIKDKYRISDKKIDLAFEISDTQKEILKKYDENSYSLYISIPFCPSICSYCSFPSGAYKSAGSYIEEYVNCLIEEMKYSAKIYGRKPSTVYIGGGTPSVLDNKYIVRIMDNLLKEYDLDNCDEITFEAGRPDSINEELLKTLKNYPITRLSINPQSMNDKTLGIIGRNHSAEDIYRAFDIAIESGFDNINSDIIIGLPNEDESDLKNTLDCLLKLPIKALTVHSLAIKKGSVLREETDYYNYIINKDIENFNRLCDLSARNNKMYPYYLYRQKNMAGNLENIGYSKRGFEGIYNILILEEKHSIVGVGAGAVTKIVCEGTPKRIPNIKDAKLYIQRFNDAISRKHEARR